MEEFKDDVKSKFDTEIIIEGRRFVIKSMTGSEYDEYLLGTHEQEYELVKGKRIPTGDIVPNIPKRNKWYLTKLISNAPYEKDGKSWKDLSEDERHEVTQGLNLKLRGVLIKKIYELNEGDDLKKKSN